MAVTFIPAFTTNAMISDFLSWILHGCVVTFQDSHRTIFIFCRWLDLLGVVLAFWISILKISKLLQNYWHRVIDITSFEKHLENSLDHTLNFCRNLMIFRSKNICQKGISHPAFYGDIVYKLRRAKDTPNFISSGSKIVKRLCWRQYDPMIIERTIGLVLGPCTALYRPFLKHCTLTNKAVGTIWRALSKPPQRRQGPDLRPLWLLVGTPSAIRPELAFSRAEHSLPYSDVTIYILLYHNYHLCFTFIWPLRLGWLLVWCLNNEVYWQIFKRVLLITRLLRGVGRLGP